MATQKDVQKIVEEVLRELDVEDLSKADPATDPDEHSPGGSGPAAPMSPEPSEPPHDEGGEQESLVDIYSQMTPEERAEHMAALQQAMAADQGAGAGGPPAPEPSPEASAPPMAMSEPVAKSEHEHQVAPRAKGHFHPEAGPCETCDAKALEKAERDKIVALEKQVKDQGEQFSKREAAMFDLVRATVGKVRPLRKSVAGVDELRFLPKGDGAPAGSNDAAEAASKMSQAQITATLNQKIPELSKSDRERVLGYYEGRVELKGIAHLLVAA